MPGLTRHLFEKRTYKRYQVGACPGPDPGPGMTLHSFQAASNNQGFTFTFTERVTVFNPWSSNVTVTV
jgi:hypothetical protein